MKTNKLYKFLFLGFIFILCYIVGFKIFSDKQVSSQFISFKNEQDFANLMLRMPIKRTSKWIVITSIQLPTEDVKRLAAYPEWTVVVVADKKTPVYWNLSNVHFLSLEIQAAMGFDTVQQLPMNSYTRKNAGYLYAIANGANWIYDTDDDNKPFGKGLDQFDFGVTKTRGLRFSSIDRSNSTTQESLFNPYRHFGRPDIWPRGFPLEHIKNHDHLDGSYRLCRVQRPPVVQQGIVHKDPDVDAIYRLLNAEPTDGLNETFSRIAPPVILAPGTYAPWNSQNTLFSRAAFFGLFLPSTVAFRVTDIWRSYFTQALLHAVGETISFVPVNAIQIRNAHNYLKDFNEETDVYTKSGEIVRFITKWKCEFETLDKCTIGLAKEFANRGFWEEKDARLITTWVHDLLKIGYNFPIVRNSSRNESSIGEDVNMNINCRRAHFSLAREPEKRMTEKINNFVEIKNWCDLSFSNKSKGWLFPQPHQLLASHNRNEALIKNSQLVAIITNNFQWNIGMGLLQRMYEANFAMLIFCGHYPKQGKHAFLNKHPDGMSNDDAFFPNLKRPINYIDLSDEEVHGGYFMYYCLAKVEEMKIQNVKGYVMFSDDTTFNYWSPFNTDIINAGRREPETIWWQTEFGEKALNQTINLMKEKSESVNEIRNFVDVMSQEISSNGNNSKINNPYAYITTNSRMKVYGDYIYVPSSNVSFAAMFAQLAYEGKLFLELFTLKLMDILPNERMDSERILYLWNQERKDWAELYSPDLLAMHPIKVSHFKDLKIRALFCDSILDSFHQNIFNVKNYNATKK